MNIYLVSPKATVDHGGYDTYSDFVVVAPDELTARRAHPGGYREWSDQLERWTDSHSGSWVRHPDQTEAELLGVADPKFTETAIIITSFHAG